MNARKSPRILTILLVAALTPGLGIPVAAESSAELLEQGIYTEETVGDLSAAIEIYTRLVENAEATRPHVAQAQFRLAVCHQKSGNDTEARAALEKLIRDFPEQEALVARAREQLSAVEPVLAMGPAPWSDGEALQYRIVLPTGKPIGIVTAAAHANGGDGVEVWQLELRKLAFTSSNARGVSRVVVDRHTQRPISSTFRHAMLGNADATYGSEGAEITGANRDRTRVESDRQIYDNEQSMHLIRMLPLEPGYATTIRFLPTWVGVIAEVGIKVTGQEPCQAPAGDFECFVVELDTVGTKQTMWISTGPERYMVKQKAGGVILELAEIGHIEPGAPVAFAVDDFGFSGTLPAGWQTYEHREPSRRNKVTIRVLDPDYDSISAVEVDRCPRGDCPGLDQTAQRELVGAEERFKGWKLRHGSWTERTIDGRPAISFVGDYERDGEPWVQYRLYTLTDDTRFEFIFRTPADSFEGLRAAFDSVAENLRAQ